MAISFFTKLQICFRILCAIITFLLAGLCFYKFINDDDVSQIYFQKYHQNSYSVYPALTLCFLNDNIFVEEKLREALTKSKYNSTVYSSFLRGEFWDDELNRVDFDSVTVNLDDYIEGIGISSAKNQTIYQHCSKNFNVILQKLMGYKCSEETQNNNRKIFNLSFKNHQSKCFSFNVPFDKDNIVLKVRILIKTSVFPKINKLKKDVQFLENFGIFLHYPHQFFRSPIRKLYHKSENESSLNSINFIINNMEVFRRRNKQKQPCNDEWNEDSKILESIVGNVGCRPPHWKATEKTNKCTNHNQIRAYNLPLINWIPRVPFLNFLEHLPPPCSTIIGITHEYSETQWKREEFEGVNGASLDFFEVNINFPNPTYKEITQLMAYNEENFVGNVGGYIGMFLGVSLLQIPELINLAYKKTRSTKEEVSKAIRSNFETGLRLMNGSLPNEVEEASVKPDRSKTPSMTIDENIHIPSLLHKVRILEEKVQLLTESNEKLKCDENCKNLIKKRMQEEVLL